MFPRFLRLTFSMALSVLFIATTAAASSGGWDRQGKRYAKEPYKILFYGDSIMSGYGLPDPEQSAFGIIKQTFQDKHDIDRPVLFLNMSHEGETTSSAVTRIKQAIALKPDVMVLAIGNNDARRGVDPDIVYNNLNIILRDLSRFGIYTLLTGMQAHQSMGYTYLSKFNGVYDKVAQVNPVVFMPYLLEGVAGNRMLMQRDGAHPNMQGHKVVADNLDNYLWRMVDRKKRQRRANEEKERWRQYMIQRNKGRRELGQPPLYTQEEIDNVTIYQEKQKYR